MAQAGRVLSDEEVREIRAYGNAGLTLPEKYADVVTDHTDIRGMVYRRRTDEEQKAVDAGVKAHADAVKADAELDAKVRAEAAKRAQQVVIPSRPEATSAAPVQRS